MEADRIEADQIQAGRQRVEFEKAERDMLLKREEEAKRVRAEEFQRDFAARREVRGLRVLPDRVRLDRVWGFGGL